MGRQKNNFQYDFLERNYSANGHYNNSVEKTAPTYPNEDLSILGIYHYGFPIPIEKTKDVKKSKLEKSFNIPEKVKEIFQKARDFVSKDTSNGVLIK